MNNFVRDLAATNTENESEELKKEALKLEESFKDLKGGTASPSVFFIVRSGIIFSPVI
jgi:hypothetical protein